MLPSESQRHQCISMGFDWGGYLSSKKAMSASVDLFHHAPMSAYWGDIGNGMKIEVLNLDCNLNTKVYWIASVIQISGYKAKLRYEGFGEDGSCDFWCNLCTLDVNAVGWCATIGKPLVPPQTIQHKYSNWKSFLVKKLTGAKTLPSDFQKRITDSVKSPFLCNFRLEVVDKTRISRMRVGIINEVVGGRLRLKYEDSDYENDDFWCHSKSTLIHPIGWCERMGHKILVSTKDYKIKKGFRNVRQELFAPVKTVKTCGFKVGMKLEAIDPLNLSAICAATVKKVLKNGYLMIGIDGSEAADGSDWFCYHCTAPSIFPVGFCIQNKISLSVPPAFKEQFSWGKYLHETDSEAAPVELFENVLPDHGFQAGMKLEAVDLMEPRLICVATVTKVVGRLLHVHFDGWENQYDQWVDCESPDIYPVGWCELVGYDLQPPPNMIAPVDPNASSKKKKVKGQSFVLKKKRKKPLGVQKKQSVDSPTSVKEEMETSLETQKSSSTSNESTEILKDSDQSQSSSIELQADNSATEKDVSDALISASMTKQNVNIDSELADHGVSSTSTKPVFHETGSSETVAEPELKQAKISDDTASDKVQEAEQMDTREQNDSNLPYKAYRNNDITKGTCDSTMQQENQQTDLTTSKQPPFDSVAQSDVTVVYSDAISSADQKNELNTTSAPSMDVDSNSTTSAQS